MEQSINFKQPQHYTHWQLKWIHSLYCLSSVISKSWHSCGCHLMQKPHTQTPLLIKHNPHGTGTACWCWSPWQDNACFNNTKTTRKQPEELSVSSFKSYWDTQDIVIHEPSASTPHVWLFETMFGWILWAKNIHTKTGNHDVLQEQCTVAMFNVINLSSFSVKADWCVWGWLII